MSLPERVLWFPNTLLIKTLSLIWYHTRRSFHWIPPSSPHQYRRPCLPPPPPAPILQPGSLRPSWVSCLSMLRPSPTLPPCFNHQHVRCWCRVLFYIGHGVLLQHQGDPRLFFGYTGRPCCLCFPRHHHRTYDGWCATAGALPLCASPQCEAFPQQLSLLAGADASSPS